MNKAIVLLSGGIDSTTALLWAKNKGYKVFALIFDYGQRHKKEIKQAKLIAKKLHCKYTVLKINLAGGSSALVNKAIAVPDRAAANSIPATYVPARNIIFLSFATAFAEEKKAQAIVIGTNQIDYSNYPDCRKDFLKAFQKAINKGTKSGIKGKAFKILAPLEDKTKAQIVKIAVKLKVPLKLTYSCYRGGRKHCGSCPSCRIRMGGFKKAGINDPSLV